MAAYCPFSVLSRNSRSSRLYCSSVLAVLCRCFQSGHCGLGGETEQRNVGADQRKAQRVHDGRVAVPGRLGDTGRDGRGARRERAAVPGQGTVAAVAARRGPSEIPIVLGPVGIRAHRSDCHIGETPGNCYRRY